VSPTTASWTAALLPNNISYQCSILKTLIQQAKLSFSSYLPMSEPPSPIKSEDFWFEDGDIVLSVAEHGVEHRFRVHRTMLTIASPVFRDMLSMPQPSSSEGGSSLVPLQDNSVQDVKALVGALYCARFVNSEANDDILIHIPQEQRRLSRLMLRWES
jgi:BTB/POZ domain